MPREPVLISSSARAGVVADVADDLERLLGHGIVRCAVDGVDGAGKTVFADELADELRGRGVEVVRVSVDGFHHPREVRHRQGRRSPEGFFEDSYDYDALRRLVLDPLGSGGDRRFARAVHDVDREIELEVVLGLAPPEGVLVLDGIFLHRDELQAEWDHSIFLDVSAETSIRRCAERDGGDPDPTAEIHRRYVEGQRIYLDRCRPRERASVVIDNTELARPRVVRRNR